VTNNKSINRQRDNVICIVILLSSLVVTVILRICLKRENHRRDRLSSEEIACEAAIKEPCDRVSLYIILLILFESCSLLASYNTILFIMWQHRLIDNKMNIFCNYTLK
jgi:hypothetical protein